MSPPNPISAAIKQICEEKNIPYEAVIQTVEAALAVAYRKDFGEKNENIKVEFNPESASARVFDVKTVVADELYEQYLQAQEEAKKVAEEAEAKAASGEQPPVDSAKQSSAASQPEAAEGEAEAEPRFDPKLHLPLAEAMAKKKDAKIGDEIRTELFPPTAYGRMAAQTAKQVIIQRLREAERETIFKLYKGREGTLLNGTVQRVEGRLVLVDLGQTAAIMPPGEQIEREYYRPGTRLKFYVVSVTMTPKGPEIVVSRSHPEMVKRLFELEVPEIASGAVEIRSISREGGSRTKIAVFSNQKNIDPVGSCVGQRGTRVQTVIGELGGEKIDIIEWSSDDVKFITNALSPAKVLSLKLDTERRLATVEVKEDQISLAIGKAGQNVRLAAKLTGWKIDIVGEEGTVRPSPGSPAAKAEAGEPAAEGAEQAPAAAAADSETPKSAVSNADQAEAKPAADSSETKPAADNGDATTDAEPPSNASDTAAKT